MVVQPAITLLELVDGWGAAYSLVFGLGTVLFFGLERAAMRAQRLTLRARGRRRRAPGSLARPGPTVIPPRCMYIAPCASVPSCSFCVVVLRSAQAGRAVRTALGQGTPDDLVRARGDAPPLLLV